MPQHASSSDSSRVPEKPSTAPVPSPSEAPLGDLTLSHRRLARYLYVAPLIAGKRVLEIGCGDGQGPTYLIERGAKAVLGLRIDELSTAASAPVKEKREPATPGVSLRNLTRSELLRAGALGAAAGSEPYGVIFLHATAELCSATLLGEVRRLLARNGHLVVSARSKEAHAADACAMGYFELLDNLSQAGFGPVAMLGQSPFIGAAVVPFGTSEPPLFFDDTLTSTEPPDEYIALCGPPPGGPAAALPYQVVKLPRQALLLPPAQASASETALAKRSEKPPEKIIERVEVPDPKVVFERDELKGRLEALQDRLNQRQEELQALRGSLLTAEAQRKELAELIHQRDRGDTEAAQAAILHERQMRELRLSLEERDAFVSELEEQARELPRLQEQLQAAQKLSEESQRSERHSRQRLAEVEGLLLRAKSELQERAQQAQLAVDLETRQRELEAMRRELLVQRVELEQGQQDLAAQRAAASSPPPTADRDAALGEVRQELLIAQERLQQQHAELEQKNRRLVAAEAEIEQLRKEPQAALSTPALGSGRRVDSDGVPLLVGDIPTAPVAVGTSLTEGQALLRQEISQLRQRLSDLQTDNERLKDKVSEAERETWKHMKARSEAEQAAAEVREDTVRKLRDARKLASVELTRAMEDATKKAVQLREELARTETERKEALAQIKDLRSARDIALEQAAGAKQELDAVRWAAELPANSAGDKGGGNSSELFEEKQRALQSLTEERSARQAAQQAADEAQLRVAELRSAVMALEQALSEARERSQSEQRRVEALEEEVRQSSGGARSEGATTELLRLQQELQQQARSLSERTAEREALARLLAEVEREAAARAERARAMRVRLSEREREVEALRAELQDRERKIGALEQKTPPSDEMIRLEADLQTTRRRIGELLEETARIEHHGDDAVATALRERARAVRMSESLDQAAREREEARNRIVELDQRLKEAHLEGERLRAELVRYGQEASSYSVPIVDRAGPSPSYDSPIGKTSSVKPTNGSGDSGL